MSNETFNPAAGVFGYTKSDNGISALHVHMTGVPMMQRMQDEKACWFEDIYAAVDAFAGDATKLAIRQRITGLQFTVDRDGRSADLIPINTAENLYEETIIDGLRTVKGRGIHKIARQFAVVYEKWHYLEYMDSRTINHHTMEE